jgi:hypothetical protein
MELARCLHPARRSSGPRRKPGLAGSFADAWRMARAAAAVLIHPAAAAFDLDRRKDYD